MENNVLDGHIRHEFRSIFNILLHFFMSLTQLVCILGLLGLQIALTVTQTCAFHLGIGFWSFPFLLLSPLSIWFVLWRRNIASCVIAILIHFCATLFATAIIIVSFLVLIGQIGFLCSTSSLNSSSIALNSALIGIAALLKLFNYMEVILLYLLIKNNSNNQPSAIFIEEYNGKDDIFSSDKAHVNVWRSWSTMPSDTHSCSDIFFA